MLPSLVAKIDVGKEWVVVDVGITSWVENWDGGTADLEVGTDVLDVIVDDSGFFVAGVVEWGVVLLVFVFSERVAEERLVTDVKYELVEAFAFGDVVILWVVNVVVDPVDGEFEADVKDISVDDWGTGTVAGPEDVGWSVDDVEKYWLVIGVENWLDVVGVTFCVVNLVVSTVERVVGLEVSDFIVDNFGLTVGLTKVEEELKVVT